jgi:plasmid segregation protein ParM
VSNTRHVIVAIDNGYGFTKVVTRDRQECLPTSVTRASPVIARAMNGPHAANERRYEIEGTVYTVGPDVLDPIDTRNDEFPYSQANLAIVMEALRRVLPDGAEARLVVNLPFNRFYTSTGDRQEIHPDRRAAALRRIVRDLSGATLPRIVDITVIPEAIAAWFDYVIGPDLHLNNQRFRELTVVIDIGARTTDIALVKEGGIYMQQSGTRDIGTLSLAAVVRRRVEDLCPDIPQRSHGSIESAVRHGTIRVGNREIDVRNALDREKKDLLERIESYCVSLCGPSMADIQRILCVGGGSVLLEPQLRKRFPNAEFPTDAQMANARGMFKSECHSSQDEQPAPPTFLSQELQEAWVAPARAALTR